MHHIIRNQRGNILFLILLAVVLFAALSYAVTNSMRGGGNDGSKESADALAAQIIQYGALVEQSVQRLRLTNGCKDTQISFQNAIVSGYTNPNAPGNNACHVFDPAGGGLAWQDPPDGALATANETYLFSGVDCIPQVGTGSDIHCWSNGTNDDNELLMTLKGITEKVCASINERVRGTREIPVQDAVYGNIFHPSNRANTTLMWKGDYSAQNATTGGHHIGTGIDGVPIGCYLKENSTYGDAYGYYHTLIAR